MSYSVSASCQLGLTVWKVDSAAIMGLINVFYCPVVMILVSGDVMGRIE